MTKKELFELMEWQVLPAEDLDEIKLIPDITVEFNGMSGQNESWYWYTAIDTESGEEFNFYIDSNEEV